MSAVKYRPDIDGLRAVAVLPVVLYHAGVPGFDGGFVGVDIFFVISGFLIAGIIQKEIEAQSFSILRFYDRRFRRILPALLTVVAATLLAGSLLLLPEELESLGGATFAAALFLSNFWFWQNTGGYFDQESEFEPLLHTWSLAVEEQFYIFFPLLLIVLAGRSARLRLRFIIALCLMSFVASVLGTRFFQAETFYLLPTRAWELGIGVMLALGKWPPPTSEKLRSGLGLASLVALALCITLYDSETLFPGLAALPVCVATGLLIWLGSGDQGLTQKCLSQRPLVLTGLVSYSWYLWHWPVLAYMRVWHGEVELPVLLQVGAIFGSLLLAFVSWQYVEKPFRKSGTSPSSTRIVIAAGSLSSLAFATMGGFLVWSDGLPSRLHSSNKVIAEAVQFGSEIQDACFSTFSSQPCELGTADRAEIDFLVWGDSHAASLLSAIDETASELGLRGSAIVSPACAPLFDIERVDRPRIERARCRDQNNALEDYLADGTGTKTIILSARWALLASGERGVGERGTRPEIAFSSSLGAQISDNWAEIFSVALEQTLKTLTERDLHVVLVGNIPEIGWNVPDALNRESRWGIPVPPPPKRNAVLRRTEPSDSLLKQFAANNGNVDYIGTSELVCPEQCRTHRGNLPFYSDSHHFTHAGSVEFLKPEFERVFLLTKRNAD